MTEPATETAGGGRREPWMPFLEALRGFVARRVPAADADDVTQDVLLRLHQGADGLRDASRAEAWVYGVARRAIADHYRRRRPPAADVDAEELAATDTQPVAAFADFSGDHSVHEEVLSWLRPMAEELPPMYRDALVMADFEGHPQRRVAAALGLSLSGAKSRVQRARALLGEALRRCCEVEMGPEGRAVDFQRNGCAACGHGGGPR